MGIISSLVLNLNSYFTKPVEIKKCDKIVIIKYFYMITNNFFSV